MKKPTRTTKAARHARVPVLTQRELANAIGGTGGTIIVENVIALPQGIQGTGRT